jgi:large subunit ribosomal protein L4
MQVPILSSEGKNVGTKTVLADWDARPVVHALLHQAVVASDANARRPWAHTKGRGEVRGGGRKPWRQKGTGRSRHGSIRSPLWKGGGATFGPRHERTYAQRVPETMKRVALGMAVVTKVRDQEFRLVEHFPESLKTKELAAFLRKLGAERSVLVSPLAEFRQSLARAGRNLRGVVVKDPKTVTAADVVKSRHLVMTPERWAVREQRIAPRRDA